MTNAWEKTGRDAASEDIAGGAEPCATLDEARTRCGAWLRSQPSLAVTDADVEACAGAYLRAWESHRRDTSDAPDLDAIEARWRRMGDLAVTRDEDGNLALTDDEDGEGYGIVARMDCDDPGFVEAAAALAGAPRDIAALVARVRDLAAKLDASAQALDDLVAQVWRATGETHEPPADVVALLERVAGLRESHCERGEALSAMARRAVAAERLLDATEGTEREEELARQIRAEASARVAAARREADQSAQKARDLAGRLYAAEGEVRLLRERCASERREGAIAMRDRIARAADEHGFGDVVRGVRLPPVDASGEGAEAMRQAYATGRTDGAATMRDAAARRAAEKGRMYAGACTNVGDDIAAAIRALPLPEAP